MEFLESMRKQYRLQQKEKASREQSGSQLVGDQQRGNTVFGQHYDYEEFVEESATEDNENTSEQSTPTFARDPLGDTAIYLEAVSIFQPCAKTKTNVWSRVSQVLVKTDGFENGSVTLQALYIKKSDRGSLRKMSVGICTSVCLS